MVASVPKDYMDGRIICLLFPRGSLTHYHLLQTVGCLEQNCKAPNHGLVKRA